MLVRDLPGINAWRKPELLSLAGSMDDIAGKTEVMNEAATKTKPKPRQSAKSIDAQAVKSIPDVAAYLSKNGITRLFHFTDVSNLSSIRKTGLMSAACLIENAMPAKMNSDALSRDLDKARGLQDSQNPKASVQASDAPNYARSGNEAWCAVL